MVTRDDLEADETIQEHVYKIVGDSKIKADVYPPKRNPQLGSPVLLFIHGGGLMGSNRKDVCAPFIDEARKMGFAIVSMDYRLAPETQVKGMLEDLEAMGLWLLDKLPSKLPGYKVDTSQIVVVGSSAGALLALSTPKHWKVHQPSAIVSLYGPANLTKLPYLHGPRLERLCFERLEITPTGEFIAPSFDTIKDGTNFKQPPSEIHQDDSEFKKSRDKMSQFVIYEGKFAEIAVKGLTIREDGQRTFPAKMTEEEEEEYLRISPVTLAANFQFPPTYIVRCENDDIFEDFHSEILRDVMTHGRLPVQDLPDIGIMKGGHAADNELEELQPVQKKVLRWLQGRVGLE